ncbi:MAG: hypothetical protein AAGL98_16115, partial [Planctomycetota bacterium]
MQQRPHFATCWLLICLAIGLTGCVPQRIATAFTDAPNGGREAVDPERIGPELFDGQGQVDVPGPPPATLAYWVMEPGAGRAVYVASGTEAS